MQTRAIPNTDLVAVGFAWHTRYGFCYDCGLPAAYYAPYRFTTSYNPSYDEDTKLCCVCAAMVAVDGIVIERCEDHDDPDEDPNEEQDPTFP